MSELIDITELITPEEDIKYFDDEESLELYFTCVHLIEEFIEEYPDIIIDPEFDDIVYDNIQELMHSLFEDDIFYNDDAQDEMENIIEYATQDYFKYHMPPRSYSDAIILNEDKTTSETNSIAVQIDKLRNKPQPVQRTKEWYEFRHNLITASNAYKAFENQNVKNQLIYEKCQPLNQELYVDNDKNDNGLDENDKKTEIKEVIMVNVNTTLHWGQKYEPLSVLIYEKMYNTKIEDFGCIQHETYSFLGASPDGINVDATNQRYGRMLEIKNIVNREINGIPKKEYWVQMQLQMEVCELDECDFLETKFIEYPDYESYIQDSKDEEYLNQCLSKDNKMKGIIIYFHTKEGKPHYEYKPLDIINSSDIEEWQENMVEKYQNNPEFNYMYIKTIYWKLEQLSCVLVCRNKQWFKDNVKHLEDIWATIEKERISGYEHRAPNRKQKKDANTSNMSITNFITINGISSSNNNNNNISVSGCLLKFNKETNKITVIKNEGDNVINTA